MFNFDYPRDMHVGRVSLELSLKPFGLDMSDAHMDAVAEELFDSWRELTQYATSVAVMLWTSDGSEILQYTGDLTQDMEWCKYIGSANPKPEFPPVKISEINPRMDVHVQPCYYIDNPPKMSYGDLKRIISAIKRVGARVTGKPIEVIETFDPGPEFAYSEFKFHRHPELNRGSMMADKWIHCAADLHADNFKYAAYPNGIPEGLPFGRFLGEQFVAFARDVGFDSVWLSNGFGFSLESWNWIGELFDGEEFNYERAPEIIESIRIFWREFTAAVGKDMRIECRGSNLSAAMDIAAHGSPIDDIYKNNIIAPPNSPWAALNYRFGLELAGYMSHIAELPAAGYMFRYYPHDPWWHNSPWFDRYDSTPHDIYLPLALARIDKDGGVTKPMGINFLSADDTYGRLPRRCPIEVTPHILRACARFPDEAGSVTWLYPFDHYAKIGLQEGKMERMFMDDWLIEGAMDNTFPLSGVVSDRSFMTCPASAFRRTVLVTPVPEKDSILETAVKKALSDGQKILFYGNPVHASDEIKTLIGVKDASPIDGELTLSTTLVKDVIRGGKYQDKLFHKSLLSNGAITEVACGNPDVTVTATVTDGTETRVYATENKKANIAYVRGSFPHNQALGKSLPEQLSTDTYFPVSTLLRHALGAFDITVAIEAETVKTSPPVLLVSRNNNAEIYTTFAKDTTSRIRLNTPIGAPLPIGTEAIVDADGATFALSKCAQNECRVYVKQQTRGVVSCMRVTAEHPYMDQRVEVVGLVDATLTFTPPIGARFELVRDGNWIVRKTNVDYIMSDDGRTITVEHLTGSIMICWQDDNNQPR